VPVSRMSATIPVALVAYQSTWATVMIHRRKLRAVRSMAKAATTEQKGHGGAHAAGRGGCLAGSLADDR